ncbi:hypothetical protein CPT03_21530 [Pedobacter ginsengisoli]|uniref:DUF4293 domain-containing protein n=1 Tax=Pedobacter ginsengisoli TaxID=363852 RepID=A0A2D1UB99_9SPHI|nr:DUF4293 domain-containing protein [Pedobacter ginsengisoli]ATP58865.1 hypothetical protein CPT03_21530 [Pedobacter ginsengisoli]
MIQRVQSIWLLLAALTLTCMLFLPFLTKNVNGSEFSVYTNGLHQSISGNEGDALVVTPFLPLFISNIAIAVLCIVAIFSFRNRTIQKRLASVAIILTLGLSFWGFNYAQKIPGGIEGANYGIAAFLPILAILFCALAIRGIRKDEQLLRSADRLR